MILIRSKFEVCGRLYEINGNTFTCGQTMSIIELGFGQVCTHKKFARLSWLD
jgi:hypothetical protein